MEAEWMGRYRSLVAQIIRQSNIAIKESSVKHNIGEGIYLNNTEWQVLEYIVEHRFDDDRMTFIHERLAIPQSTFSRIIKAFVMSGLAEKYQMSNNRKNIIIKPTQKAIDLYLKNAQNFVLPRFAGFFKGLENVSDEDLEAITKALETFNDDLENSSAVNIASPELIKLE